MNYEIKDSDRALFKRCRRAWDLGSSARQGFIPLRPPQLFDFVRAIRESLAVYYYPGMWDWNRAIVRPLALEAFAKSMHRQRQINCAVVAAASDEDRAWRDHLELGKSVLKRYFEWAPEVDDFSPIRVDAEFIANIPDLRGSDQDLVTIRGLPVRYRGYIDLLVADDDGKYWIVNHRIAEQEFPAQDELLLDEASVASCWGWETYFIGMKIAGVIHNQLIKNSSQQDSRGEMFRRTALPCSPAALESARRQIALEAQDMIDLELRLYPNPSKTNCSGCMYVSPCIAMNESGDVSAILNSSYRKRSDDPVERRLGKNTWPTNRGAAPATFRRDAPGTER
jgi:hypothetical protein